MEKSSATRSIELAEKYEGVYVSIGIHPHDAANFQALDELQELVSHPKVVAIGETGLDFFRDWAPVDKQRELFKNTITVAKNLKLPLIIHSRSSDKTNDARDEIFETLLESRC